MFMVVSRGKIKAWGTQNKVVSAVVFGCFLLTQNDMEYQKQRQTHFAQFNVPCTR